MEQTLRPYNPTWRDQLAQWVLGDQRPTAGQRSFVSGLLGSAGTGSTGASVVDMTPIGGLLSAQESAQRGDMKGAALAMLPMPAAKAGKAISSAEMRIAERARTDPATLRAQPSGLLSPVPGDESMPQKLTQSEIAEKIFADAGLSVKRSNSSAFSEKHGPSESSYLFVSDGSSDPVKVRFSGHDNGIYYDHDVAQQGFFGALGSAFNALGVTPPPRFADKRDIVNGIIARKENELAGLPYPSPDEVKTKLIDEALASAGMSGLTGRARRQAIAKTAKQWAPALSAAEKESRSKLDAARQEIMSKYQKLVDDEISGLF
jgi:hypothetical protein